MRLYAIYNAWDGDELLHGSIERIINHVDRVIIVYQEVSNYGEAYTPILPTGKKIRPVKYELEKAKSAADCERSKRNLGLHIAKQHNATHFLHMDCDEYYQDFGRALTGYLQATMGMKGSVVKLHTYFKHPTWKLENDENYFVPFIHPLRPDTFAGGRNYPFRVDPTRRINEIDVVELPIHMHHYSWVRRDIERKVRNSSARANLMKSKHLKEYNDPNTGPGTFLECYNSKLIEVPNYFNIQI
jgi:hypothetical protein